jgi:uncharacterized damage-inducible protein DinB
MMTTVKDLVLYHLEYTFEKEAWQPSLLVAIDGLSAAQASWKPAPPRHSIWQIVRHVTRWKQAALDDWHGMKPDYDAIDRGDWQDASGGDAAWHRDVQALREVSQQIMTWARGLPDAELSRPAGGEGAADGREALAVRIQRMATHDIYHAGQIRYLRALQGV